ncbi:two-component system response regulator [Actinoalloteichus sp. GBA129-24]|uniref:Two-component system response regulator n=2 Tax=Pseudonocardiaceae TaxID=2070 RepID=A0AAC9L7S0_9PSEU|nr:two-component system response regulator [Actinoalloteichus fjordicus]APU18919.1 two-component system response regulator [Actinoalloteichus sp. GBA129-24]
MDIVTAGTGPQALRLAQTGSFDAVLLDIMLPGLSGYRVLERLRAAGIATPVILVSAKDGEVDQADGLDLGADGYVVKPFSFLVLLAQLRAVLRRAGTRTEETVISVSHLRLDTATRRVSWQDSEVSLSPREYEVLTVLLRRVGSVVTKDELLQEVWGDSEAVTRNVVEVYVGYLRRKLQAVGAQEVVRTVRGHGYLADEPDSSPGAARPERGGTPRGR